MSEMYDLLAPFYDELNKDADYEGWADYIVRTLEKYAFSKVQTILDIGCGTGNVTIPLAKRGYELIGADLSSEMLNEAVNRAEASGVLSKIQFIMQDMTKLDLPEPVDAVICTLDGLNHLQTRSQLKACVQAVYASLLPGGVFIFDLNSLYKFEHVYADEVYTLETDNALCVWQNDYHPSSRFCDFWITLFTAGSDGRYDRYETVQREQYYSLETMLRLLREAGFENITVCGDKNGKCVDDNDERWYITAVKGNENGI